MVALVRSHLIETSSQLREWRFDRPKLTEIRLEKYRTWLSNGRLSSNTSEKFHTEMKPEDSVRVEQKILKEAYKKLQRLADLMKYADNIKAIALVFMQRFFLRMTVAEHYEDIQAISYACLFLAAKANECFKNVDDFVKNLPENEQITGDAVLAAELMVIRDIRFHLYVFEPYSAWNGYRLDLQGHLADRNLWMEWMDKAKTYLDRIVITDALFLYMPSQIALSSMIWAARKLAISMEDYIEKRFGEHKKMTMEIADTIVNMYRQDMETDSVD